jgi:hypothetical protein
LASKKLASTFLGSKSLERPVYNARQARGRSKNCKFEKQDLKSFSVQTLLANPERQHGSTRGPGSTGVSWDNWGNLKAISEAGQTGPVAKKYFLGLTLITSGNLYWYCFMDCYARFQNRQKQSTPIQSKYLTLMEQCITRYIKQKKFMQL